MALDPMEPFSYSTIALESRQFKSAHRTSMELRHELGYRHKFSEYQVRQRDNTES
jgi:hypothetical protein